MEEIKLSHIISGTIGSILAFIILKYFKQIQGWIGNYFKRVPEALVDDLQKITNVEILTEKSEGEIPLLTKYYNVEKEYVKHIFELNNLFNYSERIKFKIILNYFFVTFSFLLFIIIRLYAPSGWLNIFANNGDSIVVLSLRIILLAAFFFLEIFKIFQIIVLHITERELKNIFQINGIVTFSSDLVWFRKK